MCSVKFRELKSSHYVSRFSASENPEIKVNSESLSFIIGSAVIVTMSEIDSVWTKDMWQKQKTKRGKIYHCHFETNSMRFARANIFHNSLAHEVKLKEIGH